MVDVGRSQGLLVEQALELLEARRAEAPDDPCPTYELARLEHGPHPLRSIDLYDDAAKTFREEKRYREEYWAHIERADPLQSRGRFEEARQDLDQARRAAEAAGDPRLLLGLEIGEARFLLRKGEHLGKLFRDLHRIEDEVFPGGACPEGYYKICYRWLMTFGEAAFALGRDEQAAATYLRLSDLASQAGDLPRKALGSYLVAAAWMTLWTPDVHASGSREDILERLRMAMDASEGIRNRSLAALTHLTLGKLIGGDEGKAHLERCVDLARQIHLSRRLSQCLAGLAAHVAGEEPDLAWKYLDESLDVALKLGDPLNLAHGARDRMEVIWKSRSPEEAFEESLTTFEHIENLRQLQGDVASRADLLNAWSGLYYWLSGHVLASSEELQPAMLERSFSVMEQLRARTLLDALETAGVAPLPSADEIAESETLRKGIVEVQRRLLDPKLTLDEKAAILGELENLESEEADLGGRIAQSHPDYAALYEPSFATLTEVAAELAEDEALLSFQVAPGKDLFGDAGGSWALLVTHQGTRSYALPDRFDLESEVDSFRRRIEARSDIDLASSKKIFAELLTQPLQDLPQGISKLVLIPDGALHLLPFAALRASEDDPPLAERFNLSAAPSATLWLRWRSERSLEAKIPALVLADPFLPGSDGSRDSVLRSWLKDQDIVLSPLRFARQEGEAVLHHLGKPSELQVGDKATELYLKKAHLGRFAVLHLATHTLVDNLRAERSAILLAPGSSEEDGLLQFRDIVDLDLDGGVVVLSACQSATGTLLRGEGVLSLARAFFQAGAHTVVGSLWPLRDDEAARLFDAFYRYLAEGRSVSQALRQAQMEAVRAGAPAAAWAGITVLGDGGYVPFPGGLHQSPMDRRLLAAMLLVAVFVVLSVVAARLHRIRRRPWTELPEP